MVFGTRELTDQHLVLSQIQSELDHWATLDFSFDMNNDNGSKNSANKGSSRNRQRQTSAIEDDAALLAHFASSMPSGSMNMPFPESMQGSQAASLPNFTDLFNPHHLPGQQLPPGGLNQPWNQDSRDPINPNYSLDGFNFDPFAMNSLGISGSAGPSSSRQRQSTTDASDDTGSPVSTGDAPFSSAEEKRQRNTAASARFRIKKKQRTLNLERSVSDLTGRAEELEREASDLRRENGWLKEIVMLKGQHFGLGMGLSPPIASGSAQQDVHAESSSESDSEEDKKKKKRRGKKRETRGPK